MSCDNRISYGWARCASSDSGSPETAQQISESPEAVWRQINFVRRGSVVAGSRRTTRPIAGSMAPLGATRRPQAC
jgi:hypothetical protein